MGIGDELMAAGRAQAIHARTGLTVRIVDHARRPRWHEIWTGNPYIATDGQYVLRDCPGFRPYIQRFDGRRFHWRRWRPSPATVVLTPEEEAFGRAHAGLLLFEDGLKPDAPPNKQYSRWGELLPLLPGAVRLRDLGVNIRMAAAVMKHARAYVGHEGALHHLAAAFRVPAVVIMGGYVGPEQTGYALANHRYLHDGVACGTRAECPHCAAAMQAITPAMVRAALEEVAPQAAGSRKEEGVDS